MNAKRFTPFIVTTCIAATMLFVECTKPADDNRAHEGPDHASHSQGTPPPEAKSNGTLCTAHGISVALCFICDPARREKGRLWCREHGRYEDRCWSCHPELQDADRPYCDSHGLYEDECFFCDPGLAKNPGLHDAEDGRTHELFCTEHGVPETECGICHPESVARLSPGGSLKVRLPSAGSAQGAGVQTGQPSVGGITDGVKSYAELTFDQNKLAQIVAPVRGIVEAVGVDLGSRVEENATVARLWSAEIAEAVASAVLSHQVLDRERTLREQRVTSQKDLQEAEATHRAACQQLRTLGFTEEQIDVLSHDPEESVLLDVRAPFAGEIIERRAVRGELVEAGQHLFTLGDRSVMWAMLNIPETQLTQVRIGQTVELRVDSIPGRTFSGRLTWISAEVDERSRMVRARSEVPNPDGVLRARMFARARIQTHSQDGALLLPASAIQQIEGSPFVFVKLNDDLFEARRIQLGAKFNGQVEVIDGLNRKEVVALNNVFPLKSQLLISRLGAGCVHE